MCGSFSGLRFLLLLIRLLTFFASTRLLIFCKVARRLTTCSFTTLDVMVVFLISLNVCPVNAKRSIVDRGFRPLKTSIGDKFPSVGHSVVFRLYCTSDTMSGHWFRLTEGPDSPSTVRKILKHSRLWRSIVPFDHGE